MIKTENLQKVFRTDEVETWALNNALIPQHYYKIFFLST